MLGYSKQQAKLIVEFNNSLGQAKKQPRQHFTLSLGLRQTTPNTSSGRKLRGCIIHCCTTIQVKITPLCTWMFHRISIDGLSIILCVTPQQKNKSLNMERQLHTKHSLQPHYFEFCFQFLRMTLPARYYKLHIRLCLDILRGINFGLLI